MFFKIKQDVSCLTESDTRELYDSISIKFFGNWFKGFWVEFDIHKDGRGGIT